MVEGEISPRLENKGVNVTSDSLPTDNPTSTRTPATVKNLRNQVQNIINQMGPGTPHFTQNSSSEADNEESIFETTSVFSSVYKAKTEVRMRPTADKYDSSTREISECSALPLDDVPVRKEGKRYECKNCFENGAPEIQPTPPPPPPPCYCHCNFNYRPYTPLRKYHIPRKEQDKRCFLSRLLCRKNKKLEIPLELYKMDVMEQADDHSPPRKLVFNLVEGVKKPDTNSVGINTKLLTSQKVTQDAPYADNQRIQGHSAGGYRGSGCFHGPRRIRKQPVTKTTIPVDNYGAGRVDVYYFDHGNSGYYETTDCVPYVVTEMIADRTESYTTKFWADLFGTVHIGFSFVTSFILQFFRFLLYSIVRPLTVGLVQLASDYFFKPCLAVLFNALIQPLLIFFYNIATSLRDLCDPIAEGIGYFLREIAVVLRAIRVIEIRKGGGKCCVEDTRHVQAPCRGTTCEIGSEVRKYGGPGTCSG